MNKLEISAACAIGDGAATVLFRSRHSSMMAWAAARVVIVRALPSTRCACPISSIFNQWHSAFIAPQLPRIQSWQYKSRRLPDIKFGMHGAVLNNMDTGFHIPPPIDTCRLSIGIPIRVA
ncbi:hypothetical protein O0880_17200 [Janthinobacterium sp. SUN118]|nr:hypothetical protein [Janthinobacterium sp. SUN118]